MFDIGFWEILLIAVVALVVVGPERLPGFIRVCGLWFGKASATFQSVKDDISNELREHELQQDLHKELSDFNQTILNQESVASEAKMSEKAELEKDAK